MAPPLLARRDDDYTFTGYATNDPAWTARPTVVAPSASSQPSHRSLSIMSIVLWSISLFCLVICVGAVFYTLWKRRKARMSSDPYADTPLPTLDSQGRWGFTGGAPKNDGRGKWTRLEDESEPLTGDLSSPDVSPTRGKKELSDDSDFDYRK